MPIKKTRYTNENITEPLQTNDIFSDGYLFATVQADYSLSATDYMMLKNGWVSLYAWSLNIFLATFGYAMSVMPKFLSGEMAYKLEALSKGEWNTLGAGSALALLIFAVGFFMPNEKKQVMRAIDKHFKNAPKSRQQVRG
jgi:hypothetical protein